MAAFVGVVVGLVVAGVAACVGVGIVAGVGAGLAFGYAPVMRLSLLLLPVLLLVMWCSDLG